MKCFISREYDVSLNILDSIREVLSELKIDYFDMYSGEIGMNIAASVFDAIQESQIVIAIVSKMASNVLFEVGMAVGAGKAVFLLIDDKVNIPTDLRGMTYIKINENLRENLFLPLKFIMEGRKKKQKVDLSNMYKTALVNVSDDICREKLEEIKKCDSGMQFEKLVCELFEEFKGQYATLKFSDVARDVGYDIAVWIDELEDKIINPVKFDLKFGDVTRKQLDDSIKNTLKFSKSGELTIVLYYNRNNNLIHYNSGIQNIVVVEFESFIYKVFECGLAQAIWYFRNLSAHGRSCENDSL